MRAVATFLRPQVVQTVLFTDPEAFGQVRATGHLDLGALVGDAAVGVVSGHYGGRLAGASEQLFGTQLADPVARWLLPRLGNGLGWGASDAATQVAGGGSIDPVEVGGAVAVATAGGAAFSRLHVRSERRARLAFGPWPPERIPASVPALLDHLAQHNGAPPPGYTCPESRLSRAALPWATRAGDAARHPMTRRRSGTAPVRCHDRGATRPSTRRHPWRPARVGDRPSQPPRPGRNPTLNAARQLGPPGQRPPPHGRAD